MTAAISIRIRSICRRALGPVKWDVDDNRYVDYFGGHGALILGHNHPTVMAAVHAALDRGTHFGACHELEVRWAELITQMVPSAERVRFTSSGTEATLMALRLARAFTGRPKIVRFRGHFHGWNDHMTSGTSIISMAQRPAAWCSGSPTACCCAIRTTSMASTRIFNDHKDIAAVILEPTGASFGKMPILPSFLPLLRELTRQAGRDADLRRGGHRFPGVAGRPAGGDRHHAGHDDTGEDRGRRPAGRSRRRPQGHPGLARLQGHQSGGREKIGHQGTFNANPVSAAAGHRHVGDLVHDRRLRPRECVRRRRCGRR